MIRAVVDPGVFVSGLIGPADSPPAGVVDAWLEDRLEILVCPSLIDELHRVVLRPKFRRWFDETTARELVALIGRHATQCADPPPAPGVTRDPGDDYLVALARTEHADLIVSGDRDLTQSGLTDPPVRTPASLLTLLDT